MNKLIDLKDKFLKWFYQYMEQEAHRQSGADIKCPGCKEWFSVSGLRHHHTYKEAIPHGCTVVCGQCETESHWNLAAAPVPLRCDGKGNIL